MIPRSEVGRTLASSELSLDRARLRFFAQATGETSAIYMSAEAARAAGHPDIPAPPTFVLAAEMDSQASLQWLNEHAVPLGKILHAEQSFSYDRLAYAGDTLSATTRIEDVYEKKGGALEFVVMETAAVNQHGQRVSLSRSTLVIRHG